MQQFSKGCFSPSTREWTNFSSTIGLTRRSLEIHNKITEWKPCPHPQTRTGRICALKWKTRSLDGDDESFVSDCGLIVIFPRDDKEWLLVGRPPAGSYLLSKEGALTKEFLRLGSGRWRGETIILGKSLRWAPILGSWRGAANILLLLPHRLSGPNHRVGISGLEMLRLIIYGIH